MLKRRILSLFLLLCLLAAPVSAVGSTPSPYSIMVNRAMNTVTVYGLDEMGYYSIPVKAMICSTGRAGCETPLGTYWLEDWRSEWRLMLDGTYGQYATCFKGNFLFHSICYQAPSHDAMVRESYNNLGSAASMGCVRLETIDAKWIFDNCPAGTKVTVYDDPTDPGPLGKPERTVDEITPEMHNGWDPTDPAEGNPWHQIPVTALSIDPGYLNMTAGEAAVLEVSSEPANASVFWSSSDETVARVDSRGKVTALSAGSVEITVQALNGVSAQCTVYVDGELLPFDDLTPGAWYYPEIRQALEDGLFHGVSENSFSPNTPMTRAMVVQVLYNLAGQPEAPEEGFFTDVAETAWYRDAVTWAASEGIVNGVSETQFAPGRAMTRQELAVILWRYVGEPTAEGDLSLFTDAGQISGFSQSAMAWMIAEGLMQGSDGKLMPRSTASRAETAAILQRTLRAGY